MLGRIETVNLDKLNQWLTLGANIGVLVGIIFLAVEMQQNTDMMQAQTRDSITAKQLDMGMAVATDMDVARLWSEGLRNSSSFTPGSPEKARYTQLIQSILRMWENELYQYQKGLYDENEFQPRMGRWRELLQYPDPGFRRVWCEVRFSFSVDLRKLLDSYVNEVSSCEIEQAK